MSSGAARAMDQPAGESVQRAEQVAEVIRADFVDRSYYTTGNLTPSIYEPDCSFSDPANTVVGVEPYVAALKVLFDPARSRGDLLSIKVVDARTIELSWRLEGTLNVGGLRIKPYTGTTRYTLSERGLVERHSETWDISALDAFVSTLLPGFGAPPAPPVEELLRQRAGGL